MSPGTAPEIHRWVDHTTRMICMAYLDPARRSWRGYVRLPKRHPLVGRTTAAELAQLRVVGGVTHIGRLSEDGGPQWWVGFDTRGRVDARGEGDGPEADLARAYAEANADKGARRDFIRHQVAALAAQLKAMQPSQETDHAHG